MATKFLLSSKITIFILLLFAGFLGYLKYQQHIRANEIEGEKNKILAQIDTLEKKNKEIAGSLEFYKSESFKQRIAREQLNLKQPDEQVFSFKQAPQGAIPVPDEKSSNSSNPEKWLNFLTGKSK